MKKELQGFICGVLVSTIGIATAFAAGGIKSAEFNNTKVIFKGKELQLSSPLISVVKEGETNITNYMPVRTVLEGMGYDVWWNNDLKQIEISEATEKLPVTPPVANGNRGDDHTLPTVPYDIDDSPQPEYVNVDMSVYANARDALEKFTRFPERSHEYGSQLELNAQVLMLSYDNEKHEIYFHYFENLSLIGEIGYTDANLVLTIPSEELPIINSRTLIRISYVDNVVAPALNEYLRKIDN